VGDDADERRLGPFLSVNEEGHLEIDGCDSADLIAKFGAPLWVISERTIRHNYRTLRDAFRHFYPKTHVAYASKANPQPAIVRIAHLEGAKIDAVTMGHLRLLSEAGVAPKDIIFNGNSKTSDELRWALTNGVGLVNIDSLAELELLSRLAPVDGEPLDVCLRLASDDTRHADDAKFAEHKAHAKFGMDSDDALSAADLVLEHPGIRLVGLHHHLGWTAYGVPYSVELDLMRHTRAVEQVLEFASLLASSRNVVVSVLNFGGGFRVGRPEGFGPAGIAECPPVDDYARAVAGRVAELLSAYGLGEPTLMLEAGGYLVADAGVLLAEVGLSKRRVSAFGSRRWIFLENTSSYHFVRRLIYGFEHHLVPATRMRDRPAGVFSVAGPVCADDNIGLDVPLPDLKAGDILAVLDQGAYCEAVSSDYCSVPVPAAGACQAR